jgi:hypothetical protein
MKFLVATFVRRLSLCLLMALLIAPPATAVAQGTVTVCTAAELEAAIADGGSITFECDGTIILTNTIHITEDTDLDGTGRGVTISGLTGANATNAVRLFTVEPGVTLTLINLKLINGRSTNGGAIFVSSNGTLEVTSCIFSNNLAIGTNGISGSSPSTNSTGRTGRDGGGGKHGQGASGGAVYNLGSAMFSQCTFLTNTASGGHGGDGGNGGNGTLIGGDGGSAGRGGAGFGGAICNLNELTVFECAFHENLAVGGFAGQGGFGFIAGFPGLDGHGAAGGGGSGAAIFNHKLATAEVKNSTFALNGTASGDSSSAGRGGNRGPRGHNGPASVGGALANYGMAELENCTFFANVVVGGGGGDGGEGSFQGGRGGSGGAGWGGNVFNGGKKATLSAVNCTFTDGGASGGTNGLGGVSPFPGKDGSRGASRGGNIANSNGVFFLKNSLIAYPSPGTNASGKFRDDGFNLSSDRSIRFLKGSGSLIVKASAAANELKLGVLARNGGRVETIELFTNSPAIDAADPNFFPETDARGVGRPGGDRPDIGAYESGVVLGPPRILVQPTSLTLREGDGVTFTVTAQGDPPLLYRWRKVGDDFIEDATESSFTIDFVTDDDAGEYEVVVSNNSGSVTSEPATLTVVHPPTITDPLLDLGVSSGAAFTLAVTAEGDEPLTYRWFINDVEKLGAILSTYSVLGADSQDAGRYRVLVCNEFGCDESEAVVTITNSRPFIVTQPLNRVVAISNNVTFSVVAGGSQPFSYQWFFNDEVRPGATGSSLTINNAQPTNAGTYRVVVSNTFGSVTSTNVTLIVQTNRPTVLVQPVDTGVPAGSQASFSVTAGGDAPFTYQWFFNTNTTLAGGTNATLVLTNVQNVNVGSYRVIVSNTIGNATSAPVNLTVQATAPSIQVAPVSTNAFTGNTARFTVTAAGSDPLHYQWYFNTTNLLFSGVNSTLTLLNVQATNAGSYHVVVTNSLGSVTSAPVTLTISTSLPVITEPPASVSALPATRVAFNVAVQGSQPILYQWVFNGTPLFSPTNSTFNLINPVSGSLLLITNGPAGSSLTIPLIAPADEGSYQLIMSNEFGTASTLEEVLDVLGF